MTNLDHLTSGALVNEYNQAAAILGESTVKKFSDKKTAIRRTTAILARVETTPEEPVVAEEEKPATESKKLWSNFLGMRQDIKASDEQVPLKREGSIRAQALKVLLNGATLEQLTEVFSEHDKRRGITGKDSVRRSYEMVRIFCHYHGYGTKSSEDGQTIQLVIE